MIIYTHACKLLMEKMKLRNKLVSVVDLFLERCASNPSAPLYYFSPTGLLVHSEQYTYGELQQKIQSIA